MAQSRESQAALLATVSSEARSLPLSQAREAFRRAEVKLLQSGGEPCDLADLLVEEARWLAGLLDPRQLAEAHALLARAQGLLDASPAPSVAGKLLHVRGYVHLREGRPDRALGPLLEARKRFVEAGERLGEARVLDTLGMLWDRRGDVQRAALSVASALALKQQLGDKEGAAISLGNLGRIALHGGRAEEAESFFLLDIDVARQIGDQRGEAMVRVNLSECRLAQGRAEEAEADASQALAQARAAGDSKAEGFALVALANALFAQGRSGEALSRTDEAEAVFRGSGAAAVAHAHLARARILAAQGKGAAAARSAILGARAARTVSLGDLEIDSFLAGFRALDSAGDSRRARRMLERARDSALRYGFDSRLDRVLSEDRTIAASQVESRTEVRIEVDLAAGRLLGSAGKSIPFRVEMFLGQGAFGTVVLVQSLVSGDRFALKRLHPGKDRMRSLADRLRREFTAVAHIVDPHVVRPHAFGSEGGRPCLLLEYVEPAGAYRSLKDVLDDLTVVPVPVAARYGRDIALGLAALHRAGVVHRDLKPSNVLLNRDGGAMVADHGLVYDTHESCYIPVHEFKGTLAFAAPEMCTLVSGRAPQPSPAADLYALGTILFQSLSGKLPLPLEDVEGSIVDLLCAKASARARDLAQLNPTVPAALVELVHRLIQPKPEDRPQDAAEVASRLAALVEPARPEAGPS